MAVCALCDKEVEDCQLLEPFFESKEAEVAIKLRGGGKVCMKCCRSLCADADRDDLVDLLFNAHDEASGLRGEIE